MKVEILAVCLLVTLPGMTRAEPAPAAEAPVLDAKRQALEARRSALAAQAAEVETELKRLEAEVREVDPTGRLTNAQLYNLLLTREERRSGVPVDPASILIPVAAFSCLLTGFLAWLYARYRKERQVHETVRLMVEKGAEIPSGLLAPPPKKPSDLRRGLILATTGVGLTVFLAALPGAHGAWGAGVTLLLIGVGHLLVWRLQGGRGPLRSALTPESLS